MRSQGIQLKPFVMQVTMTQMSVQSASDGIELFSIEPPYQTRHSWTPEKAQNSKIKRLGMNEECGIFWCAHIQEIPNWVTYFKYLVVISHVEGGDNEL